MTLRRYLPDLFPDRKFSWTEIGPLLNMTPKDAAEYLGITEWPFLAATRAQLERQDLTHYIFKPPAAGMPAQPVAYFWSDVERSWCELDRPLTHEDLHSPSWYLVDTPCYSCRSPESGDFTVEMTDDIYQVNDSGMLIKESRNENVDWSEILPPAASRPVFVVQPPVEPVVIEAPEKQTRGTRNNNPGNIEYHAGNNWRGQTGSDGRFAIFDTPEHGIRALAKLVRNYETKYGLNTVARLISRWAPSDENNTDSYISAVSKSIGVKPNEKLNLHNVREVGKLTSAIIHHENGFDPYSGAQVMAGVELAFA